MKGSRPAKGGSPTSGGHPLALPVTVAATALAETDGPGSGP